MKDREVTKQLVLALGQDGNSFTLDDVLGVEGVAESAPMDDHATLRKSRARSYMRYVFSSEGLKLRSVGKNTYKIVDESDPIERLAEYKKKEKQMYKAAHEFKRYREFRISKGDPIQIDMHTEEIMRLIEGGDFNVSNEKSNQIVPVTSASAKPKKASGQ